MPNTPIASIAPYQHILDRWQENKAVAAEAARKEREKLEKIARCQTEVQEIVAEMRANLAAAQEKAGGRALSAEEVAEANPVNGKLQDAAAGSSGSSEVGGRSCIAPEGSVAIL